jgi:hypothetical protein
MSGIEFVAAPRIWTRGARNATHETSATGCQRETADAARPLPYDVPGQCFGHRRNNAQREESGFRRGIAGTGGSQPVVLRKLKLGGFGLVE